MAKKKKFCPLLKEMLKDEERAVVRYNNLAGITSNAKIKQIIRNIRKDEAGHHIELKKIFEKNCG